MTSYPEVSVYPYRANSLESDMRKALSTRQSLGVSTVRYIQHFAAEFPSTQCAEITELLFVLLPRADIRDVSKAVAKFAAKAMELKNAMTQEHAVYQCCWMQSGAGFDAELVELADDEEGLISLCTFPGLRRIVFNEGGRNEFCIVKASAVLESALPFQRDPSTQSHDEMR